MKTVVWKYRVPDADEDHAIIHKGAVPLSVRMTPEGPRMWFLVDVNAPLVKLHMRVVATGQHLMALTNMRHFGSFQIAATDVHVFMGEESPNVQRDKHEDTVVQKRKPIERGPIRRA